MLITRDSSGQVFLGRAEYLVQLLIVLSLFAYALETERELPDQWRAYLKYFEIFTVGAFSVEYLVRAYFTQPRRSYVLSFLGMVDLLAVLPFYLASGADLRTLRAFRLMRLFRILKLARYSSAMMRLHRAFVIAREELFLFGAVALILLYLSAVGIHHFESEAQPEKFASLFDSLWWAIVTLTTVGYGDIYPMTPGGKCFTMFVLLIGVGFIAVPTGLIASALGKARDEDDSSDSK